MQVVIEGILDMQCHPERHWRRIIFWGEPAAPAANGGQSSEGRGPEPAAVETHKPNAAAATSTPGAVSQTIQSTVAVTGASSTAAMLGPDDAGSPRSCCSPNTLPDWESAGACWVDISQLQHLPLRSPNEPWKWFPVMAGGLDQLPRGLTLPEEWLDVFEGFPCC